MHALTLFRSSLRGAAMFAVLLLVVICLAFANGANDVFKGVATLYGSGTTAYRTALAWATATTLAGSIAAVILAEKLLKSFSGKGLVPDSLVADPAFAASVALGAGATVLFASRIGLPVSTTHALVGGLAGAGWAAGPDLHLVRLGEWFLLPLLVSPFVAIAATLAIYPVFRFARRGLGVNDACVCVGIEPAPAASEALVASVATAAPAASFAPRTLTAPVATGALGPSATAGAMAAPGAGGLSVTVGAAGSCRARYAGRVLGIEADAIVDKLHFLSAGAVSFARGLNDTPKIAAMLLLVPHVGNFGSTTLVAVAMAVGGVLGARRVAETTSRRITEMNHGQGFTANLVTSLVVIGASRFGLPVSTTHVSCGALFGIGTANGRAEVRTIARILLAWVATLPTAAACGYVAYRVLGGG